jgi:hypothetical protein
MSEQKPSHEVEGIVLRAPRQDCVEVQKGTKNTVAILKWKKFGTTKTLPRACQTEQSEEKALGQGGDQEPNGHSDRAPEMGEPSRRTTSSASLPQSGL